MTRAARITFVVAGLAGLSLGIAAGCQHAKLASGAMQSFATLAASSVTSDFALQQFEHANNAHARQAATLQINTLEQVERVTGESISKSELGYAYMRLAMIEDRLGRQKRNIVRWFGRGNGSSELVLAMSLQTSN